MTTLGVALFPSSRAARMAARPAPAIAAARRNAGEGRRAPCRRARGGEAPCRSGAGGERLPQCGDEVGSRLEPLWRILGERALEDGVELRGQIGQRGDGRDRSLDVRASLGRRAVGLERPPAGEQLEGDDSERITVAGRAGPFALGLLGREVPGGPHHRPGHRERLHAGSAGDPEVGDVQRTLSVEQKVARLHVPVDDSAAVRCVESRGRLLEPRQRLAGGGRTGPLQTLFERSTAQVLHDDEGALLPLADVEDRHRARLAGEARRGERLTLEASPDRGVSGVALGQQLDRDGAPEHLVLGSEDLAHAARADALRPAVARGQLALFDWHEERRWRPRFLQFPAASLGKRPACWRILKFV